MEKIKDQLATTAPQATALPPVLKLAIFLDYLQSNAMHHHVGRQTHLQISRSCATHYINFVARIIAGLSSEFVRLPDMAERSHIAEEFYTRSSFPWCWGVADGSHIRIAKPSCADYTGFYNCKHFYSLNCLFICDHNHKIRYFTNRHKGSAHDAKIFGESHLAALLEAEFNQRKPFALIGDEAFPCSQIMLPPVRDIQLANEDDPNVREKMVQYNIVHKKTRIIIEHTFGILKRRWPALLYGVRCDKLENAQVIIGIKRQ